MVESTTTTAWYPPRIEEVRAYFSQKGMTVQEAECFFLFFEKNQWCSKKGVLQKKWKETAYRWIAAILKTEPWRFNKNVR